MLGEILDDDLAQELNTSPPHPLKLTIRLTPLSVKQGSAKKEKDDDDDDDDFSLQPLSQSPDKPTPTALDTQDSTRWVLTDTQRFGIQGAIPEENNSQ